MPPRPPASEIHLCVQTLLSKNPGSAPAKLFNFEIQKYGQILCAHKPYFLIRTYVHTHTCTYYNELIQYIVVATYVYVVKIHIIIENAIF